MFYKLLGYLVWNGGKLFLRRRYGSTYVPKGVLVGAALMAVAAVAAAAAAAKHNGSSSS
jgi:hypothetical protein